MKKMLIVAACISTLAFSGCVNQALLNSAESYDNATKPYLTTILGAEKITVTENGEKIEEVYTPEEKESLKQAMDQFKKMIEAYKNAKKWYEF